MGWQDAPIEGGKRAAAWEAAPIEGAAPKAESAPSGLGSDGQNFLAGIGQSMTSLGRGASQLVRKLGPQFEASADAFGLPNQADIDEAKRLDAPLLNTKAGLAGAVIGSAVPAVVAAPLAGAGVAGNALLGAALGGAQPVATGDSRAMNIAAGGAGGAAGALVSKGIVSAFDKAGASRAAAKTANAGRDSAAAAAKQAGYVLPPTETNPSMLNSALEGLSGKVKTAQSASTKNQNVTNNLVKAELGLPADAPISVDALKTIRANAGQAYDAVSAAGAITPGKAYSDALDKIVKPYVQSAKAFPNAKPNPIIQEIEALRSQQFDAADAVAKIRTLRADADAAYGAGNKDLGKSLKSGADALEDAIDAHLSAIGASADVLKSFRDARQTIAKTYSVEKALNPTTGDVAASALASQLKRGKPLSGWLRTAGEAGQAFPKATQSLPQSYNAVSPLDYAAGFGGLAASGNPLSLAALVARPAARGLILSKPYQAAMANPSYGAPLSDLLSSGPVQQGVRLGGITSPQLFQQK